MKINKIPVNYEMYRNLNDSLEDKAKSMNILSHIDKLTTKDSFKQDEIEISLNKVKQTMPVVQFLTETFVNKKFVVSNPSALLQWRGWNAEDDDTLERYKGIVTNTIIYLSRAFNAEGFATNSNIEDANAEEFKLEIQEKAHTKSRNAEVEFVVKKDKLTYKAVSNKNDKVKCEIELKKYEKYNPSNVAGSIFLSIYLNICKNLKLTPFRYVCRKMYLDAVIADFNRTYGKVNNLFEQFNKDKFEKDFDEKSSASARFVIGFFDNKKENLSNYKVELKVKLNTSKIQDLLKKFEKDADAFITYLETTNLNDKDAAFIFNIKVANAPVMNISVMDVNNLPVYFANGFYQERQRQKTSNAQTAQTRTYKHLEKANKDTLKIDISDRPFLLKFLQDEKNMGNYVVESPLFDGYEIGVIADHNVRISAYLTICEEPNTYICYVSARKVIVKNKNFVIDNADTEQFFYADANPTKSGTESFVLKDAMDFSRFRAKLNSLFRKAQEETEKRYGTTNGINTDVPVGKKKVNK